MLLAPVREESAGGGADVTYEETAGTWAGIRTRAAGERDAGGRLHSRTTHELTLRFRDDAAPGWRVRWDGRDRRVTAAFDPDGLRRRTILICEEEE